MGRFFVVWDKRCYNDK